MHSTLLHTFFENANQWSGRAAIIDKNGESYTFEQLKESAAYVQERSNTFGLTLQDVVIVAVPMSFKLYPILLALISKGVICVFLDPWFTRKQMNDLIKELDPKLIILDKKFRLFSVFLPSLWTIRKWFVGELKGVSSSIVLQELPEDGTALVTYTSGTSGKPKGANRTLGFLKAQIEASEGYLNRNQPQIDYTNFPIVGLACLYYGNTVVVPDIKLKEIHTAEPEKIVNQIIDSNTTRLIVSPSILKKVVRKAKIDRVSEVITGGAPLTQKLAGETLIKYGQSKLINLYGSTESEPIASTSFQEYHNNFSNDFEGLLAGEVYEKTKIKLINPSLGFIEEVQGGEVGEIIVTGDHVNKGYFRNEAAFFENKLKDDHGTIWHRTNDTGYLKDGDLYLVGSKNRIINRDAKQFHPFPIENWARKTFKIEDLAYFEKDGKILFVYYADHSLDETGLQSQFKNKNIPLDQVVNYNGPLPKDPRHRGKLDLSKIILN